MRRRCRTGNVRRGGIGGRFCILASEIRTQRGAGNYAGTGVPDIPCRMRTLWRPADVTAWAERVTNRARSQGCRGGARCRWRSPPVFETPALMRVFRVGPASAGRNLGKAVQEACACSRVVPGTGAHTKGTTESIRLGEVGGGWTIGSTRPGRRTRRCAQNSVCGDASFVLRAAHTVFQRRFTRRESGPRCATAMEFATATLEYSGRDSRIRDGSAMPVLPQVLSL